MDTMSQTTTRTHDDHLIIASDALGKIARAVAETMAGGDFMSHQLANAAEKAAEGFTDDELVSCWHVFHHQETVQGRSDMRSLRFAMAHEHKSRIQSALVRVSSEDILARWEADPVPFSVGPGTLERSHQEACNDEMEARLGEPLFEAMDEFLDAWALTRDEDEDVDARNARFRAGEIAVCRRVLAAQS